MMPYMTYAAGPVIRSGETIAVEASQVIEGDFYGFAQSMILSGVSEHDVYVAGGTVTVNAPVAEDLVILSGAAQVHGDVGDDVRIIGGEVTLAKPVANDVVVLGGTVHILSTATIGGDLIFLGGDIRVDGPVAGSVYGAAEKIRIDARVGGDVTIRTSESVTLGDAADIAGNLTYKSSNELTRGQGAVVSGSITRGEIITQTTGADFQSIVLAILMCIFSSLTLFFIARTRIERLATEAWSLYGRSGLIGLGMVLAIPIIAVILMASVIGIVVGFGLLLMYLLLFAITCMALPIYLGTLVERFVRKGSTFSLFTIMIGVFVTVVLPFIPVIGAFLIFLTVLVVFGSLCLELYRVFRTA
jgi:cytoskeletal protein CcmA (bactofilin family)